MWYYVVMSMLFGKQSFHAPDGSMQVTSARQEGTKIS